MFLQAQKEAEDKAEELLEMPPVMNPREPIDHQLAKDDALQGLLTSTYVFTDITYGLSLKVTFHMSISFGFK